MKKRGRKGNPKKIIIGVLILAVIVGAICTVIAMKKKKAINSQEFVVTDTVMRDNLEVSITGEAAVEPYERFEIISMVSGDILSSPYEVGESVAEGDVLYRFDSSDMETNIRKQEISLEQSENNLNNAKSDLEDSRENLEITAPCSGYISGIEKEIGDDVSNNETFAKIENTDMLEVELPFTKLQIESMYVGQPATVSSSAHMSNVDGVVTEISQHSVAKEDGSNVHHVTIEFKNPGAFTQGLTVGGAVGDMVSPGYGEVKLTETGNVVVKMAGELEKVNYKNGDYIEEGTVIAVIDSKALQSQERSIRSSELNLKNSQISMQETRDSLDDYSITSPISGTVITKNAKAGDTIDRTNSSTVLMVVADVSKLKFSLEIDELDVSKVSVGQRVDITCDALPGEKFVGEITKVSVEGTATNGVTTYTAEVVINNPGNLRPSMNVDAGVIIDSAENVLIVPSQDIKSAMGVSYVFLQDETGTRGAKEEDFINAMRKGMSQFAEKANANMEGKKMPEGMESKMPGYGEKREVPTEGEMTQNIKPKEMQGEKTGEKPENNDIKQNKGRPNEKQDDKNANQRSRLPEAPEGFVVAIVETGLSDDEYTEIKSGLKEGDQIQQISSSSSSNMMGMMRMMGGMSGGGMPSGGMPSGNMGGNRGGMR